MIDVFVQIKPQVFHCKYKGIWPIADLYCSSRTLNVRATQIISPHEIKVSEGGSERNFD